MVPNVQDRVAAARGFLDSRGMAATPEWLKGCVEYFLEENPDGAQRDLFSMVGSQWTLGNLRDMSPGRLPPGLADSALVTLPGLYALQMDSLIDIGTPAYKQLQEIRKIDTADVHLAHDRPDKDPPPQRMLKLTLTDGAQTVHAIEYRPIRNLTVALPPGTKVEIKGPVHCRRGVLMLEEKHVTVLGGEADDLLESNAYINILLRKINAPNIFGTTAASAHISSGNNIRDDAASTMTSDGANAPDRPNHFQTGASRPPQTCSTRTNDANWNADTFDDDNIDLTEIEAIENKVIRSTNSAENIRKNKKIELNNVDRTDHSRSFQNEPILIDDYSMDEEYCDRPTATVNPSISLENFTNTRGYPTVVNKNPFIYIKQLVESPPELKLNNTYVVKAQVFKVVGKLSLQKTAWILRCTLVDGSDGMDVDFESGVLSKIIGYTPEDMIKLKKQMATKPQLKQTLMEALDNAMSKIQNFDCLFHVNFIKSNALVVKIEEFNEYHISKLQERLLLAS